MPGTLIYTFKFYSPNIIPVLNIKKTKAEKSINKIIIYCLAGFFEK